MRTIRPRAERDPSARRRGGLVVAGRQLLPARTCTRDRFRPGLRLDPDIARRPPLRRVAGPVAARDSRDAGELGTSPRDDGPVGGGCVAVWRLVRRSGLVATLRSTWLDRLSGAWLHLFREPNQSRS